MHITKLLKVTRTSISITAFASLSLVFSNAAFANINDMFYNAGQRLGMYTLDCAHWYAGGNIGMSHTHDEKNPGSGNSVDQNGPGWSVVGGYQFNSLLGAELGYTQYHDSRETSGSTVVAKTEHYAVHLAATGRYPLIDRWSALGKLGAAYSYAQKIASATGAAQSSGAGGVYWGLGLSYSITPKIDFIAQFAEAVGNHLTGSTDLWSVGLNVALV